MLQNLCEISTDYPALLRQLKDPLKLRASEQVIQFPFALPVVEEKTEEELARITEKRREQGRKLQEMAAKTRMEKVRTPLIITALCRYPIVFVARAKGKRFAIPACFEGGESRGQQAGMGGMRFSTGKDDQ